MRDDFNLKTKTVLSKRVGNKCSNPNCRTITDGPHTDSDKSINIGVASHITAASMGGPRYDMQMSSEERKSIENGIWLCQSCSKLIDSDNLRYTKELLYHWKRLSEEAALLEIEGKPNPDSNMDKEIVENYRVFFDRPAFQDAIRQEGSIEDFDKAIEDTIIAINTGSLRSRNGVELNKTYGKSFIENDEVRMRLNLIVDLLRALRERYKYAITEGKINISNGSDNQIFYCFNDSEIANWFDSTRDDILNIFETICKELKIKWKNQGFRKRRL